MDIGDHIRFTSTGCRGLVVKVMTRARTGAQPSLFTSSADLTPMASTVARSPLSLAFIETVAEVL